MSTFNKLRLTTYIKNKKLGNKLKKYIKNIKNILKSIVNIHFKYFLFKYFCNKQDIYV